MPIRLPGGTRSTSGGPASGSRRACAIAASSSASPATKRGVDHVRVSRHGSHEARASVRESVLTFVVESIVCKCASRPGGCWWSTTIRASPLDPPRARVRGLHRRRRGRRDRGAGAGARAHAGSGRARSDAAWPGWYRGVSSAARRRRGADSDADRPRCHRRSGPRARLRRRRLPGQTVRATKSCWPACARCCAAPHRRRGRRMLRWDDLALDVAAHEAWRGQRADRADRAGVRAARAVPGTPAPGADRQRSARLGVGLSDAIRPATWSTSTLATCGQARGGGEPRLLHTVRGVGYVLRAA